ncbi:MAG: ABC transporter substrate-binding protein, partial [Deltaproteobacteria bacterium]|nr:ABC transporter substrate-binding protein [Deltaproteobacteria bacterium]
QRPEDLRGRRVGVQSIGGTVHVRTLSALDRMGLDPERDRIQVLVIGDESVMAQALLAGQVDGVAVGYAFASVLRAQGLRGWDLGKLGVSEVGQLLFTTRAFARAEPESVTRFLRAIGESVAYFKRPQNREEVIRLTARRLKTVPEAVIPEYEALQRVIPNNLVPDPRAMQEVHALLRRLNPRVQAVRLEDLVDLGPLRKLEAEGFFARLHAR